MKYRAGQRKKTCFFKKLTFRPNSSARIIYTVRYDGYDKNSTGQTKMEPGVSDARLVEGTPGYPYAPFAAGEEMR